MAKKKEASTELASTETPIEPTETKTEEVVTEPESKDATVVLETPIVILDEPAILGAGAGVAPLPTSDELKEALEKLESGEIEPVALPPVVEEQADGSLSRDFPTEEERFWRTHGVSVQ